MRCEMMRRRIAMVLTIILVIGCLGSTVLAISPSDKEILTYVDTQYENLKDAKKQLYTIGQDLYRDKCADSPAPNAVSRLNMLSNETQRDRKSVVEGKMYVLV